MADTKVKVDIDVATKAADLALKRFNAQVQNSDQLWNVFKANLASQFTFAAIQNGIQALTEFGRVVIAESSEAEQSLKNLEVALNSVGITSQESFNELVEYSEGLERTTKFSAEAAQASIALLASLTNLDKNGLQQATSAAADLATRLNVDLDTATNLVIKSINGNVGALGRYGLEVKKGSTETENFANTLQALSKFSGTATQSIDTFAGASNQATNGYNEILETIGDFITQNQAVVNVLKEVSNIFFEFADGIKGNSTSFSVVFTQSLISVIDIINVTVVVLDTLQRAFTAVFRQIEVIVLAVVNSIVQGLNIIGVTSDQTAEAMTGTLEAARDRLNSAFSEDSFLGEASVALFRLKGAAEEGFEAMKKGADASKPATDGATDSVRNLGTVSEETQKKLESFAQKLIEQSEDKKAFYDQQIADLEANSELERQIMQNNFTNRLIDTEEFGAQQQELELRLAQEKAFALEEQRLIDEEQLLAARNQGLINQQEYNIAREQLDKNYNDKVAKSQLDLQKKQLKIDQDTQLAREKNQKTAIQGTADMFGAFAELAALGGEKTFKTMQAFQIAEAITSGYLSIQRAAEVAPYPFNIPSIVAATALSLANIAKIKSAKPSFATGGVVGGFNGATVGGDNRTANVRDGEMMLNANQQRNLFDIANGSLPSNQNSEIVVHTNVTLDGETIAKAVSRQVANGLQLGVAGV